jgi:hypothetical protein
MDLRRSINVKFWTDEWIEKLDYKEKLLFLYLLTNPLANLLGIYKISIKRISFETGLTEETVTNGLKAFQKVSKCFYMDEFVILVNHLKNQCLNPNMIKNVMCEYEKLPNSLKDKLKLNPSECFESLLNGLQTLSTYEKSKEKEKEKEDESENCKKSKTLFRNSPYFNNMVLIEEKIGDKYLIYNLNFYYESVLNWSDGKNALASDWLATMRNFILKDIKSNNPRLKQG